MAPVSREEVLSRIRECASRDNGKPPGKRLFEQQTGIREADWLGRYWARWGDALADAGYPPNTLQGRVWSDDDLLAALATLTAELGRFPTTPELALRRREDEAFPSKNLFGTRLGSRDEQVRKLTAYLQRTGQHALADALPVPVPEPQPVADTDRSSGEVGFVYLLRYGRRDYKIGRSGSPGRRSYEVALQLPEEVHLVHSIETDDPVGIERYWHQRFSERRTRGEWFRLSPEDVRAFKRRRFM